MSPASLILVLFILANLPWLSNRLMLVFKLANGKSVLIRLIETIVFYFIGLMIAIAFEIQFSGDVYQQGWEFFVTTFSLFLVLAVPSLVYRYQWLTMSKKVKRT